MRAGWVVHLRGSVGASTRLHLTLGRLPLDNWRSAGDRALAGGRYPVNPIESKQQTKETLTQTVKRGNNGNNVKIKGSICKKEMTLVNVYASKARVPGYGNRC